jgi:hypothetical protein
MVCAGNLGSRPVHKKDRLLLDERELDADNAGYTVVQPLPQPHWKVFLFLS